MERIAVLVVDDHPIFLEGFCTLVRLEYPEIEIRGAVTDGREAVDAFEALSPDVVIMDIRMPGMDGVEAARKIRKIDPDAKIVMLTTFKDTDLIQDALAAGVKGYMLKETPVPVVIENIKSVYHGNFLLPGNLAEHIIQNTVSDEKSAGRKPAGILSRGDVPAEISRLTSREIEILDLMLRNYNNSMIADTLFIGEHTVRNYVSKIYDVLNVHNRAELILWAIDHHVK